MTVEEARIYFSSHDSEELQEEYLAELFKHKNFFINSFPINKVFSARLKKLGKIRSAYLTLGGSDERSEYVAMEVRFDSDSIGDAFREYSSLRSVLKGKIMLANSILDLESVVIDLLENTRLYAKVWQYDYKNFDGVLVSNEMDQMNVLNQIKKLEASGDVTILDLQKLDIENVLVRESKRLSLWLKLDSYV